MDYIDQKQYAQTINSAKNKPTPQLKWYKESELNTQLLKIQERGVKPSNTLPYDYHVNLENGQIVMHNLTENAVPLMIYDKSKFAEGEHFFSYAIYSKQKLMHEIIAEKYNFEVIGANGFVRKFNGTDRPSIQVQFINKTSENKIGIGFKPITKNPLIVQLENKYEKKSQQIEMKYEEQSHIFDLNKMKGWYDLEIKHGNNIWYFAGRIESGKPTTTDPHWC